MTTSLKIVCFLLCCSMWVHSAAARPSLNATWQYSKNSDGASDFFQEYGVGIGALGGGAPLTDRLHLAFGGLRYSREIEDDSSYTDKFGTSLSLVNAARFYTLRISGNYSYESESDGEKTSFFWVDGGINLDQELMRGSWFDRYKLQPSLRVSYDRRQDALGNTTDIYSVFPSLDWNYFDWLSFSYAATYRYEPAYGAEDVDSENLSQSTSLTSSESFFGGKLSYTGGLNYEHTRNTQTRDAGFAGGLLDLNASAAWTECDDISDAAILCNSAAADTTLTASAPQDDPANPQFLQYLQLEVEFSAPQNDVVVFLKADEDVDQDLASRLSWTLYTRSGPVADWQGGGGLQPLYNEAEDRFEFQIAFESLQDGQNIALVIDKDMSDLHPGDVVTFGPVAVFEQLPADDLSAIDRETISQAWGGNFTLGYRISPTLFSSYSFGYNKNESAGTNDSDTISNMLTLNMHTGPLFSASTSVNETRHDTSDLLQTRRDYALNLGSSPIPTLRLASAASVSETYEDSELERRSFSSNISSAMALYDDLDAFLELGYSEVLSQEDEGKLSERARLSGRLRPAMQFALDLNFGQDLNDDTSTSNQSLSLVWRLSDMLQASQLIAVGRETDVDTVYSYSLSLYITPTVPHRFTLNYFFTEQGDTHSQNISGEWTWNINRYFYFRASGNYVPANGTGEDLWRVLTKLEFNLRP